jgi:hypothetical protein
VPEKVKITNPTAAARIHRSFWERLQVASLVRMSLGVLQNIHPPLKSNAGTNSPGGTNNNNKHNTNCRLTQLGAATWPEIPSPPPILQPFHPNLKGPAVFSNWDTSGNLQRKPSPAQNALQ